MVSLLFDSMQNNPYHSSYYIENQLLLKGHNHFTLQDQGCVKSLVSELPSKKIDSNPSDYKYLLDKYHSIVAQANPPKKCITLCKLQGAPASKPDVNDLATKLWKFAVKKLHKLLLLQKIENQKQIIGKEDQWGVTQPVAPNSKFLALEKAPFLFDPKGNPQQMDIKVQQAFQDALNALEKPAREQLKKEVEQELVLLSNKSNDQASLKLKKISFVQAAYKISEKFEEPVVIAEEGDPKDQTAGLVSGKAAAAATAQFYIKCKPYANGNTEIPVAIARLPKMSLNNAALFKIFKLVNFHTLNQPYPCAAYDFVSSDGGEKIWRPNHNGTHSARQARLLEAGIDMIKGCGSQEVKEIWSKLTSSEIMNLKLAAYFLRAGRMDESTSVGVANPDDYRTRSAQIYEAYAKQLQVNPDTIKWIKILIGNSLKPINVRSAKEIDDIPRNLLCHNLLSLAHKLDLMRCFDSQMDDRELQEVREIVGSLLHNKYDTALHVFQLMTFANELLLASGSVITYEPYRNGGNLAKFHLHSTNGAICWKQLTDVALPLWKSSVFEEEIQRLWSFAAIPSDIDLMPSELLALKLYTSSLYQSMNALVASETQTRPLSKYEIIGDREVLLKVVKVAKSALQKLPSFQTDPKLPTVLYRGVYLNPSQAAVYQVGAVVTEGRFLSTSRVLESANKLAALGFERNSKRIIFVFHKCKLGKDISQYSTGPNEKEVLFPPHTRFRVLRVRDIDDFNGVRVELDFKEAAASGAAAQQPKKELQIDLEEVA